LGFYQKKKIQCGWKKPESLPKVAFDAFWIIFEKFVVPETARRENLEFCKYLEYLSTWKMENITNCISQKKWIRFKF